MMKKMELKKYQLGEILDATKGASLSGEVAFRLSLFS